MIKTFKTIEGFEDYIVSNDGTIINAKTGQEIVGSVRKNGYRSVILIRNGERHDKLIHRLVAEAFCKKRNGAEEVNHIDGNKLNNSADNLEWVTRGENLKHAYEKGLMPNNTTPREVLATNIETGEQATFSSIYKAARFLNISQGNICMCCKGLRPNAGGYIWEYKEEKDE